MLSFAISTVSLLFIGASSLYHMWARMFSNTDEFKSKQRNAQLGLVVCLLLFALLRIASQLSAVSLEVGTAASPAASNNNNNNNNVQQLLMAATGLASNNINNNNIPLVISDVTLQRVREQVAAAQYQWISTPTTASASSNDDERVLNNDVYTSLSLFIIFSELSRVFLVAAQWFMVLHVSSLVRWKLDALRICMSFVTTTHVVSGLGALLSLCSVCWIFFGVIDSDLSALLIMLAYHLAGIASGAILLTLVDVAARIRGTAVVATGRAQLMRKAQSRVINICTCIGCAVCFALPLVRFFAVSRIGAQQCYIIMNLSEMVIAVGLLQTWSASKPTPITSGSQSPISPSMAAAAFAAASSLDIPNVNGSCCTFNNSLPPHFLLAGTALPSSSSSTTLVSLLGATTSSSSPHSISLGKRKNSTSSCCSQCSFEEDANSTSASSSLGSASSSSTVTTIKLLHVTACD